MDDETIPVAPAIGGDSYEVGEWLRRVRDEYADQFEGELAIMREVVAAFETANPEIKA